ncbi:MAG: hypothetical protein ACLUFN_04405 [Eubacterium sp.]
MEISLISQILLIISSIFSLGFKVLYVYAIYFNCKANRRTKLVLYVFGSIFLPIITGIVCLSQNKNAEKNKDYKKSVIMVIIALVFLVVSFVAAVVGNNYKWLDSKGNGYSELSKVSYYDKDGNTYNYDFDKHGYDYLYINGTDERLNADLCYLDENGLLYYDKEMNITAKDSSSCVDENGDLYYPVKYSFFNEDNKISYEFSSFSYDREGNAYTYDYVPYFDKNGKKYGYSFDSNTQKGTYTNVFTGEEFDNKYCFVDENGYFVYDSEHKFVLQKNSKYSNQYMDINGKIYYWASGVSWDKNGKMYDSYDRIIN